MRLISQQQQQQQQQQPQHHMTTRRRALLERTSGDTPDWSYGQSVLSLFSPSSAHLHPHPHPHPHLHFSTFLCLSLLLISVSPDEEECFPWKFVNTIFQCCTKTSNHFHHHNCTILKPDRVQLVNGSNLIKALKFIQNIILSWATTSQPHSLMYP